MKKLIIIALVLVLMLAVVACGKEEATPEVTPPADAGETAEATPPAEAGEVAGLTEPIAETPILLTSVGQSADVEMVKVLLEKADMEPTVVGLATSADLADYKTLVLAVGGSSKGLGAAGIDADEEIARVEELTDAAKEQGVTVIAVHIGGEARRGDLSDRFMEPSFKNADYAVVVSTGNRDGAMSDMAAKYGVPMDESESMAAAVEPLKKAFK